MNEDLFVNEIPVQDKLISATNVELLHSYLTDRDHTLVFFIGAGASLAGNTGMPSTPSLLFYLLSQALSSSGKFTGEHDEWPIVLREISSAIGFEITLNDFWQICRDATPLVYQAFSDVEKQCLPNRVHNFMAYWLSKGGAVVTTNYDRLIEQEWSKITSLPKTRYSIIAPNSFIAWENELNEGGVLFKIHGSLDDPNSCLGALEHVGTQLFGERAVLLTKIIETRPLCFVGWRGVDPDIPPLLYKTLSRRDSTLPIFWIHHEGYPPKFTSLEEAINGCTLLVQPLASEYPILTEADRLFGRFLEWVDMPKLPNPERPVNHFDFTTAIESCSNAGLTRMVGIALRRGGKHAEAAKVLQTALELAQTEVEYSTTLQELSLLEQQQTGRETGEARQYLKTARDRLKSVSDINIQLNIDFGLLSMSIVNIKSKPWLLFALPGLFSRYHQSIQALHQRKRDKESVALHESLYQLYLGRLRFKLLGWLAIMIHPLAAWIIEPFNRARAQIDKAKDISLHSRIDVLAYRAIALAFLGGCEDIQDDVAEVTRLTSILNDDARTRHWHNQQDEIQRYCQ